MGFLTDQITHGFVTRRITAIPATIEFDTSALDYGAQGIGLCRTEHMFFDERARDAVVRMILAGDDKEKRLAALDEMLEKIAMGKVNKYLKENTLLNQVFVRDGKKVVRDYLKETNGELTVTGFQRVMLGA